MTQAENIYINACIMGTLIIYRIKPDITSIAPYEGVMIFALANWLLTKEYREDLS